MELFDQVDVSLKVFLKVVLITIPDVGFFTFFKIGVVLLLGHVLKNPITLVK